MCKVEHSLSVGMPQGLGASLWIRNHGSSPEVMARSGAAGAALPLVIVVGATAKGHGGMGLYASLCEHHRGCRGLSSLSEMCVQKHLRM